MPLLKCVSYPRGLVCVSPQYLYPPENHGTLKATRGRGVDALVTLLWWGLSQREAPSQPHCPQAVLMSKSGMQNTLCVVKGVGGQGSGLGQGAKDVPVILGGPGAKWCRVSIPEVLGLCGNRWRHQAHAQPQRLGRWPRTAATWEFQASLGSTGRLCLKEQTRKKQLVLGWMVAFLGRSIWWGCPTPIKVKGPPRVSLSGCGLAGQGRGVTAQSAVE